MRKPEPDLLSAVLAVVIIFALAIGLGAVMAFPTMWLWNILLTGPDSIIGVPLPTIGFWQSWGLIVLCRLTVAQHSTSTAKKD